MTKISQPSASRSSNVSIHSNTATVDEIIAGCVIPLAQLKRSTDPSTLPKTTEDIATPTAIPTSGFGQSRAMNAIDTAISIRAKGYHIFAVGENGLGKRTFVRDYLQYLNKPQGKLADWVYVHNFDNPKHPTALCLPAGMAPYLSNAMIQLWHAVKAGLQHSEAVVANVTATGAKATDTREPDSATRINDIIHNIVDPAIDDIIKTIYTNAHAGADSDVNVNVRSNDNSKLTHYLNSVRDDLYQHASIIRNISNIGDGTSVDHDERFRTHPLTTIPSRYDINIIATNESTSSKNQSDIPIVYEDAPSIERLVGYIGQTQYLGTTVTDVSMIQSGALHQANGGYLLLKASYLLSHPESWQALKHILKNQEIQLPCYEQFSERSTNGQYLSLKPDPIPLNVKVILLGDPNTYDEFFERDAELTSLFKIRADFHDEVSRTHENELAMVATMASLINKHKLLPFNAKAQATILEELSLQAEDQDKLSLHTTYLAQLMLESNHHASHHASHHEKESDSQYVTAKHVKQALYDIDYRSGYLKELYLDELTSGQQLISVSGEAVGQINALTVIDYADSEFGMPARLTAVVQHSEGSGDILDIERDVELGGSLHAKGMLIMNSYLRALFSPYHPLNFTASLAFEQSYAHIDGDSATLAEACALLSALAGIPISQSLAITGSMNQLGMVQAVGGINAKISGFYDTCHHQGLTGSQGVIIPYANTNQLMLRDDIIEAIKADKFHIYGVTSLGEALTILTKMSIDALNKNGHYRKSSLFGKVLKNLKKWDEDLNYSGNNDNTPVSK